MKCAKSVGFNILILFIYTVILVVLVVVEPVSYWAQINLQMLYGWIIFIIDSTTMLKFDWREFSVFVASSIICVMLIKNLGSWFAKSKNHSFSWMNSLKFYSLMVLFFVAGICILGIVHNTTWLCMKFRW